MKKAKMQNGKETKTNELSIYYFNSCDGDPQLTHIQLFTPYEESNNVGLINFIYVLMFTEKKAGSAKLA